MGEGNTDDEETLVTSPSHDSRDPRAYFIIRYLASGLAEVFEDLRFEPLFKRHLWWRLQRAFNDLRPAVLAAMKNCP